MRFQRLNESVVELVSPIGNPEVDVVFFHGLQPHYGQAFWNTWSCGREETTWSETSLAQAIWPQALLAPELPRARILSVSYQDACAQTGAQTWEKAERVDAEVIGEFLHTDIIESDLAEVGRNRPVILVGHSLGGLVIKSLLLSAERKRDAADHEDIGESCYSVVDNFLNNVVGIFYYATPHGGSDVAKYAPKWTLRGVDTGAHKPILAYLRALDARADSINEDFRKWRETHRKPALTIIESLPTKLWQDRVSFLVVSEASAQQDTDFWYKAENTDHLTVCTPNSKSCATFKLMERFIRQCVFKRNRMLYIGSLADREMPDERMESQSTSVRQEPPDLDPGPGANSRTQSPRSVIRPDICEMGFKSFEEKFNPEKILCLYQVVATMDRVYMIFFHTEGMAALMGIGLPFSKVLLQKSESSVKVEEMSEFSWKRLWTNLNEARSFRPMIFRKPASLDGLRSTSSGISGMSTVETLSNPEEGLDGNNHIEVGSTHDGIEAETSSSGTCWTSWLDELLKLQKSIVDERDKNILKRKNEFKEQMLRRRSERRALSRMFLVRQNSDHGEDSVSSRDMDEPRSWTHVSTPRMNESWPRESVIRSRSCPNSESSTIGIDGEDFVFIDEFSTQSLKENAISGSVKKLVVHVEMTELHCKFYEKVFMNTARGKRSVDQEYDIGKDDVLCTCFIKPKMIVEFVSTPSDASKEITVTAKVDYEIDGHTEDANKFGWYQDEMSVSFECKDPRASIIDANAHRIISSLETTEKGCSGKLLSEEIDQARMGLDTSNESLAGSTSTNLSLDIANISKVQHSLSESPGFDVVSACAENKMAYKAFLSHELEPENLWDNIERHRAEATGMFSTVNIEVQGRWSVTGTGNKTYQLAAEKKVSQHTRSSKYVLENPNWSRSKYVLESKVMLATLRQKICRGFILNHSFSHLHLQGLGMSEAYQWVLVDPQKTSSALSLVC